MVKAQVKMGGRGKAGGVKFAQTPEEAREKAGRILGHGHQGPQVTGVLVTQASDIAEEYYFSFLLDRANRTFLAMAPHEGGMEIEQLAVERPDALAQDPGRRADPGSTRPRPREIVAAGKFPAEVRDQVVDVIVNLWETFVAEDATLVEVNPLVRDPQGKVVALDGKVTLDDNAGFRHPDHAALVDQRTRGPARGEGEGEGPQLRQARRRGRDHRQRRRPGDVHPGRRRLRRREARRGEARRTSWTSAAARRAEVMANGLDIILPDPDVKSVFVNVFGGITACDAVANGIVGALKMLGARGEQAAGRPAGRQQRRWRAGGSSTRPNHPLVTQADTMDNAADKAAELAAARRV